MFLFRDAVFRLRQFRLHGDVALTGTPSHCALIALLNAIVALVALWAVLGQYARTERVVGRIVPDGAVARIVPTRAGVIVRLAVHEGQWVRPGQPLAVVMVEQGTLDRTDPAAAGLGSLDRQQVLIDRQIALSARSQTEDARKLAASLEEARAEIAALDREADLQRAIVQSARNSFEPLTQVTEQGFFSRIQYETKRQEYLAAQSQLAQLAARRAQVAGQRDQARAALTALPTQTASRVNDLQGTRAALLQKRIEIENGRSYVITASVAGRVSALQVSQGAMVTSQMPLMSVVSDGVRLEAELYAPSRAIGFARVGQDVRLMYDAFPYQRFGSFAGRITAISRTVLAPDELDAPIRGQAREPVYKLRVALAGQSVAAFGQRIPLQPGMTLSANLVLDRRSFLDWLLEPINAVRNRA